MAYESVFACECVLNRLKVANTDKIGAYLLDSAIASVKNGALWDFETYVVPSMQLDERFDRPVACDRRDVTQHWYVDHWTQE